MNIAIIVRKLNVRGGTQRQAIFLARELKRLGHNVKLYTFLYSPEHCYENELKGLEVKTLGFYPAHSRFLFLHENRAAKKLADIIDWDTDILNPHDHVSYRVASYFKKHRRNIPSVWMMNDMPTRVFSLMRERAMDEGITQSFVKKIIARFLDSREIKSFISMQDIIAVLDNRDRDLVKRFFHKEAVVVRSGIDLALFPFHAHVPPDKKHVRLLANGIFFSHRRFEDIIEAVKLLRNTGVEATLAIAGGFSPHDPYYKKIAALRDSLNLSSEISFLGKTTDEGLRWAYENSDIFVFSSHLQSWGLAVFEAMASGIPVIVSQTSGASEILTNGVNAFLIPPQSPPAIAAAVRELVEGHERYEQFSLKGRAFVQQTLSWERYANDMIKLFRAVREGNKNFF